MLVEGEHFNLKWHPPGKLGRKAVAVNLSDLAAMGARSEAILVSLACPENTPLALLVELFAGMLELCLESGVSLVGGDTCKADRLILCITALGRCGEGSPVRIDGAAVGQAIYVTACPGLSALGLKLLQRFGPDRIPPEFQESLEIHLNPPVAWRQAPAIARQFALGAMTDVSDGIARDLGKICQASGCGARVDFSAFPWHRELVKAQTVYGWDPVRLALEGGEDYCLLFTADAAKIESAWRASELFASLHLLKLGEICPASEGFSALLPGGNLITIDPSGFDHFRQSAS
jgi:thiamine-monophosphate kinase